MIRLLTAFILIFTVSWTAFAQTPPDPALRNAAKDGTPVRTRLTVLGNVTAQAVLIPRVNARRIFGAEIANNYAIIEVNVGNKSPDAALIIHGVFIDYSRWGLSGNLGQPATVDGMLREAADPFQASTRSNQIASLEYRVVRGQLLDAQMWTARNWTMRLLTLAGSLASGFSFSIGEEGIVKGLQAFGSVGVPGLREAWPDSTIEQLNRISDFGYQTNKVIAKQGAEVIVGFFPIDRFLTPGFKQLFQKSPALFFAPLQMLVDPKLKRDVNKLLKGLSKDGSVDKLAPLLPCYIQITDALKYGMDKGRILGSKIQNETSGCEAKFGLKAVPDNKKVLFEVVNPATFETTFAALDFISKMSLNSVTVVVDGVMTVETLTIPAKIDAVAFDIAENCGDAAKPCFWSDVLNQEGVRFGTIAGSYLTGGEIEILNANDLGITDVKTISDESSDQELHFSFKLTRPIESQKVLQIRVSKPQQGDTQPPRRVVSLMRDVLVSYTKAPPTITDATRDGKSVTVKGTGFAPVPPNFPLVVKLSTLDGEEVEATLDEVRDNQLKLTITADPKPADRFNVEVTVGVFEPVRRSVTNKPGQ